MGLRPFLLVPAVLAASACSAEMEREPIARAPGIEALGEPVNCLPLNRIRDTTVHDDFTIDFETVDGQTYRNTLPRQCYSLGFERRFGYATSINRLCSTDIVNVLYSDGRRGPGCGLGEFLPVRVIRQEPGAEPVVRPAS
ncbi:hypothetical protein [Altericroceibacterium xinjiangense]|uniref:hypothetical protein n=1 Tax=Altericroceibacterium xinjiangense TaxID=762261 RepID=UPI000F7E31F7|nr:hypothetical protein [Altericroceibacterium xinjiangense]